MKTATTSQRPPSQYEEGISGAEKKRREHANAIFELREMLQPGDRLQTVSRHVSRSGMSRNISVIATVKGEIRNISGLVSEALGYPWVNGAVKVGGCGMDMGFHIVYNLGRVLFQGNYRCLGAGCRSNDHANWRPGQPKIKKGQQHSDAGYALKQEWL